MRRDWTEEEINFLREFYPKQGRKYCGEKLNRSIESVRRKADSLGIKLEKEARSRISREGCTKANKDRIIDRTGEESINFQGYEIVVIKSNGAHDVTVQFNDYRKSIRYNVSYQEFLKGSVKNLFHPEIYGVGYFGEGVYTARVDEKMSKCYTSWINMLGRCYNLLNLKKQNSYKDVTVCQEWHNFQNFAEWFYKNYNPEIMSNWHLDKDLICKECKMYSPKTCCLLPPEVNAIFQNKVISKSTGVRGVHKEGNKYTTTISKFGKQTYLGLYETIEEAHNAYNNAKKEYLDELSERWKGTLPDKVCNAIRDFDIRLL